MSINVYYANAKKRRNSTLQATFTEDNKYTCTLKEETSLDHPTFLFSGNWIGWNVAKWGNRYYFVDDVRAVRNGMWEVDCVLDVLATYKTDILNSTQYVSYSSQSGGTWLPDTRIPSLTNSFVSSTTSNSLDFLDMDGCYVLGVVGDNGCELFGVTQDDIRLILGALNNWKNTDYNAIITNADGQFIYDWDLEPTKSRAMFDMATAFKSAEWSNAPNCIRSCTWVPFKRSYFQVGAAKNIRLGTYLTVVNTKALSGKSVNMTGVTITIPWHFSDWRRVTNEDVYIYLPFVGVIKLPNGDINQCTKIQVRISANAIDGSIQYQLKGDASGYLGNYGAKLGCEYPIGINQGKSATDIYQTRLNNSSSLISSLSSISLLNPVGIITSPFNVMNTVEQIGLNEKRVQVERTATSIGTFGASSVASGMFNDVIMWTVSNDTVITPSSMKNTMGVPTMKPMSLSTLTGYCQCSNAHVSADANANELVEIDNYLNNGFYIE